MSGKRRRRGKVLSRIKLEAKVVDAQACLMATQEMIRRCRRERDNLLQELGDWDAEVRRLLGPYTAFQRQTPTVTVDAHRPGYRVPVPVPMEAMMYAPRESLAHHSEVMRMFRVTMRSHDLEMRQVIRFEAVDRGGAVAYALSEIMLERQGFGPRDVEWLARKIATEMLGWKHGKYLARGVGQPN